MKTVIVDNFFENPDKVRDFALHDDRVIYRSRNAQEYFEGMRTECLSLVDPEFYQYATRKIIESYGVDDKNFEVDGDLVFNYLTKENETDINHKDFGKRIHNDQNCILSGIVYLSPYPPKDTGTIIYKEGGWDIVQNIYNRCLIFPSGQIPHAPQSFFGDNKYDSRLTLLFFLRGIDKSTEI
jgi:hypothetical protein